jgi:hypothetical protein
MIGIGIGLIGIWMILKLTILILELE